jgi:hypothetical protein
MKVLYIVICMLFALAGSQAIAGYKNGSISDWPATDPDPFGDKEQLENERQA